MLPPNVSSIGSTETNNTPLTWGTNMHNNVFSTYHLFGMLLRQCSTLDSGIDVAPGINVAPGTFGKNIKRSP